MDSPVSFRPGCQDLSTRLQLPTFLSETPNTSVAKISPEEELALDTEIQPLVEKREVVHLKHNSGWRPIINLKHLNNHLTAPYFKMEGIHSSRVPTAYTYSMHVCTFYILHSHRCSRFALVNCCQASSLNAPPTTCQATIIKHLV